MTEVHLIWNYMYSLFIGVWKWLSPGRRLQSALIKE